MTDKNLVRLAFWIAISAVMLVVFAVAAFGQTVPVYCQADTIKAMKSIWAQSGNGTLGFEATFLLNGTPDAYTIEPVPYTNEHMQQHIRLRRNTFALFHVHPNMSGEYPSTPSNAYTGGRGDTGMADDFNIDIYVVSSRGLSVYRSSTETTTKLREGYNWAKAKGCQ